MFSTLDASLEFRHRRRGALVCGVLSEALLIAAAGLLAVLFPSELPEANRHYAATIWLSMLTPPQKPVLKPPRKMARVSIPKLQFPEAPELAPPPVVHLVVPKDRHTLAFVPVAPPPVPAPPVAQPNPPPKVEIVIHTGLFGGAPELVTTKRPVKEVQTGGFGSPQGFRGRAQGDSPGNVPKLGSFGLPDGPGVGNGTGGSHGVQGVVASAGFGSGVAGAGYSSGAGGYGNPVVALGGFEKVAQVAPSSAPSPHVPPPADFQPVEIVSKPSPVYSEEARHLGIQGEVALSVVFQASGTVRVMGVVKSLGHGLDQAALKAATQIRFKPALRAGQPADFPAVLRIQFRLADQST